MTPIRTILHATDFSASAEGAFSVATMLAREHHARIVVLHVYPTPIWRGEEVDRRRGDGYEDDLWHLLDKYQPPDPAIPVDRLLAEGDAVTEILRVAGEEGCDVIVMGTQGRTGLARFLMGSVAAKVMRGATCPVLAVHLPASAAAPKAREAETASA